MDSARSWFQKFQYKEKKESASENEVQDVPSSATKQKVEVAKQYIENHYKSQMKSLQDRKERYFFVYTFLCSNSLVTLVGSPWDQA